jgi:hypothetical protein
MSTALDDDAALFGDIDSWDTLEEMGIGESGTILPDTTTTTTATATNTTTGAAAAAAAARAGAGEQVGTGASEGRGGVATSRSVPVSSVHQQDDNADGDGFEDGDLDEDDHGCDNDSSTEEAAAAKRKRAAMSKEERAKQNRDRNREHARNTRLRKKAFVEELKRQVEELVEAKEREDRERQSAVDRANAKQEIWRQVMAKFLLHRSSGTGTHAEWTAILEEEFELRLPYEADPAFACGKTGIARGVGAAMADAASLRQDDGSQMSFVLRSETFCVMGSVAMAALNCSAGPGEELPGMIRCEFSSNNKLKSAEIVYDAHGLLMLLRRGQQDSKPGQQPQLVGEEVDLVSLVMKQQQVQLQSSCPADITTDACGSTLLNSIVSDLREHRVTSTVIESCSEPGMRSYLRMYPLGEEGDEVKHFIGVLEKIAEPGNGYSSGGGSGRSGDSTESCKSHTTASTTGTEHAFSCGEAGAERSESGTKPRPTRSSTRKMQASSSS